MWVGGIQATYLGLEERPSALHTAHPRLRITSRLRDTGEESVPTAQQKLQKRVGTESTSSGGGHPPWTKPNQNEGQLHKRSTSSGVLTRTQQVMKVYKINNKNGSNSKCWSEWEGLEREDN